MSGTNVFKRLSVSTHTDTGRRRQKNEDSLLCLHDHGVFIVADGMGGAGGGDVASKAVIDHLNEAYDNKAELGLTEKVSLFRGACDAASGWIKTRADRSSTRGMGSTVVGLIFDNLDKRRAAVLHAGDSRVYLYRNEEFRKMVVDHSPAAEAGIDDESLVPFFMQGIITRAVGVQSKVMLELTYIEVEEADQLLICSDGLYNMLSDDEMIEVLEQAANGDDAVRALVDEANNAGGLDNTTVILIDVGVEGKDS